MTRAGDQPRAAPPAPGYTPQGLFQAVPTDTGPSLYSVQTATGAIQTLVQAFTSDGQQLWQTALNSSYAGLSVPRRFRRHDRGQRLRQHQLHPAHAYRVGMYFSVNDAAHATSTNYLGEPNPLPASLPLYLIPNGPPGHKPAAAGFTSQQ